MAAVLHVGEDAVLSHASAAFSYGLRRSPPDRVEILIPHERRVREPEGIRIQRCRGLARRIDDRAMPGLTTGRAHGSGPRSRRHRGRGRGTCRARLPERAYVGRAPLDVLESRRRHRWMSLLREALGDIGDGAQSTPEVRYVRDVERPHGLPKRSSTAGRPSAPSGPMSSTRPAGWRGTSVRSCRAAAGVAVRLAVDVEAAVMAKSVGKPPNSRKNDCGETGPRQAGVRFPQSGGLDRPRAVSRLSARRRRVGSTDLDTLDAEGTKGDVRPGASHHRAQRRLH